MASTDTLQPAGAPTLGAAPSPAWLGGWLARDESPQVRHALRRSLAIVIAVTLVTAYFSEVFFKPDEHWEIVEYLSYKLGTTAPSELHWEFHHGIRSWMQPWLYYLVAKPLALVGVRDLFVIVSILRMLTGLASLAAFVLFADAMVADLVDRDEKLAYARSLPLFGFLPYLFVRTSSVALSAAFFTAGFALLIRDTAAARPRRFLAAGLLFGFAVECRYQTGLLAAGAFLWLALVARVRVASLGAFVLGGLLPVLLALFVDHWGYGYWSFPPVRYVTDNIALASEHYGTDPVYGYVYLMAANIFLPLVVALLIAMVVTWIRNPRHAVTWTTLPFVVIHSLIAHKEARFLFPILMLSTAFPVLAFGPAQDRIRPAFARLWAFRGSLPVKLVAVLSVACMALLAVFPLGIWTHHDPMAKYVYRHFPGGLVAYSFDRAPFQSYPMYRPKPFASSRLESSDDLERLLAHGPVYLFSDLPSLAGTLPDDARATLLFSELPFADHPGIAALATRLVRKFRRGEEHGALLSLFRIERAPAQAPAAASDAS